MITAEEARSRISPSNDDFNKEEVMKDIEKKIEEAIKDDKDYCELGYELDEDVKEELENKWHYTVCEWKSHGWDNNTIIKFGRNKK